MRGNVSYIKWIWNVLCCENKEAYTFKEALIRIRNIWINYALITITFVIVDLIFGKITLDPVKILLNLLALDFSYNNYAWFMITYIVIMLVFPLCHWAFKQVNWLAKIIFILMIKVGITVLNMGISHFINVPEIVYKTFIEPFMFLPAFLIGYICAEYDVFRVIYEKLFKGKLEKLKLTILLIVILIFIYKFEYTILDNITAPIICFLIAYLGNGNLIGKGLRYIGKHSTNMWLIHYPIMILLLNKVVYYPRISVFILVWLIILVLPICYLAEFAYTKIMKISRR